MAASANRASWSVVALWGSSWNARAICSAQPSERHLAHPPDDGVDPAVAGAGGLDGEGDQ